MMQHGYEKNSGFSRLERDVLANELCCRCGTCIGICPTGCLSVDGNALKPFMGAGGSCVGCGKCQAVCPGLSTPYATLYERIFGRFPKTGEAYGICRRFCIGKTTDRQIYEKCAGGGLVTQLIHNLLREKFIDAAVIAGFSIEKPYVPVGKIVDQKADLVENLNSIYVCIPVNVVMNQVRNSGKKVAVVGVPCSIAALRKAQIEFPKEMENVVLLIGIFCGINIGQEATLFYLDKMRVDRTEIIRYSTRTKSEGYGIHVDLKSGEKIRKKNVAIHLGLAPIFAPLRCRMCPDMTNEFADISVGDTWLNDGRSVILARTAVGEDALCCSRDMELKNAEGFSAHRQAIINKKIKAKYLTRLTVRARGFTSEFEMNGNLVCPSDWESRDRSLFSVIHRLFSNQAVRNATKHLLVSDQYLSLPVDATHRLKYLLIAKYAFPIWNRPVKP